MAAEGFVARHIGPREADVQSMLGTLGYEDLSSLVQAAIPQSIRMTGALALPEALDEVQALAQLRDRAAANQVLRACIGMGYHDCITPPVVLRNVLENPGWYTAYTPYQAEISQGRLEVLLTFQTMIQELTALDVAGASLLDEGTAAAEAMAMALRSSKRKSATVFAVSMHCHPQTIAVVQTRAEALGVQVVVEDLAVFELHEDVFGVLAQYPDTTGEVTDLRPLCERAHAVGALVTVATDLLALTVLTPPGELGADIAVGNAGRFGVPLGFGGPHAGFLATRSALARKMPGRLIGVSRDRRGQQALRMALQTREQHIRREKATSNVCTAQVLLAVVAALYAVWHGPDGLRAIAERTHAHARNFAAGLQRGRYHVKADTFFDTVQVDVGEHCDAIFEGAQGAGYNLRRVDERTLGVAFDETTTADDVTRLLAAFGCGAEPADATGPDPLVAHRRQSQYLQHDVFQRYHSETEMLRYIHRLQTKDLALDTAMIPLGSCTMKLNATTQMIPITWPGFNGLHPFAPKEQAQGYAVLMAELQDWLAQLTGYDAVSLQPNAGSQGEYAGLQVIRAYHASRGESHRDVCLIPTSAHGTNPASAALAGMRVVAVACNDQGDIDVADLKAKAQKHAAQLGALMVTYPSTHGVFEERIREVCDIVHEHGGQVYVDGANFNAMVGLCRPGDFGGDVSHLNLHKTFAIPHGGGGPGMGPIGVKAHLAPFLPGHPVVSTGGEQAIGPISAAPFGSASILPISWAYIAMLGEEGLRRSSEIAILNANYIAKRLEGVFPVLYSGKNGLVAHECIVDFRAFKAVGVEVVDIAKRLMDYGFHGPTMSWPVTGTLMIEPTESESKWEIDRFCDALIQIREEIREIEEGRADSADNLLHGAPHTAAEVCGDLWEHSYSRERAAFPTEHTRQHKFWPSVSRIDDAWGDRNLCTCLWDGKSDPE